MRQFGIHWRGDLLRRWFRHVMVLLIFTRCRRILLKSLLLLEEFLRQLLPSMCIQYLFILLKVRTTRTFLYLYVCWNKNLYSSGGENAGVVTYEQSPKIFKGRSVVSDSAKHIGKLAGGSSPSTHWERKSWNDPKKNLAFRLCLWKKTVGSRDADSKSIDLFSSLPGCTWREYQREDIRYPSLFSLPIYGNLYPLPLTTSKTLTKGLDLWRSL